MDLTSGLTLGRIRGIDIRVHWSWLLIFGLLTWSLANGLFGETFQQWSDQQRWSAAIATSLLFFVSVLLHELAHAFVAQRYGLPVPFITLFVFGGVSSLAGEMRTPGEEFRVAIVGPLVSGLLAVLFGVLWLVLRDTDVATMFAYLAWINAALGLFNLLPGFPLDGGRVLRSVVWARSKNLLRATRVASIAGSVIGYGLILLGLVSVFAVGLFGGLWYVLIGLFMKSAAEGAYASMRAERTVEHALERLTARSVMREAPLAVDGTLTLQQLVDDYVLGTAERAFLVAEDGAVVGMVTNSDIMRLPRERWAETRVIEAMIPADDVVTVSAEQPLFEALRLMQRHDIHQVPVLSQGRLVGMLTRADVLQHVEVRSQFQRDGDG